ncbi:small multidrug resistance pump [Sphaerotilus hippei]|uniref:Small multidrug resistance pump n=1 Tax=Sphaerotilus hippei TaxID=744406 RepID=A0A318H655_9BURK|nr:multidrug efflux SMR transporter [Sphaerotilus hippei]PXW99440.1 small multidrug resistance pump [Sphaerotilus hippei]
MHWLQLLLAILFETAATSALKASDGFTRPGPSLLSAAGYACSFYLLAQALRVVPVGVAYAIWSGAGVVLISVVAAVLFRQRLDLPAMLGIGLIVAGVVVINLSSSASGH